MPRAFSMSIQSDTVARRPPLPCTAPASVMTCACSARASVSVDLPASGWLITANVRRGRWSDTRRTYRWTLAEPLSGEAATGGALLLAGGAAAAQPADQARGVRLGGGVVDQPVEQLVVAGRGQCEP